jgi:hypothetical protein
MLFAAAATTVVRGQGMVAVCVVMWCEGLDYRSVFQRRAMVMGQVSVGCIPTDGLQLVVSSCLYGRVSLAALFKAMARWRSSWPGWVVVHLLSLTTSSAAEAESMASTKDFMAFNVILFSSRVFCARWLGQLSLLYPSSACLYLYQFVLVFLTV